MFNVGYQLSIIEIVDISSSSFINLNVDVRSFSLFLFRALLFDVSLCSTIGLS